MLNSVFGSQGFSNYRSVAKQPQFAGDNKNNTGQFSIEQLKKEIAQHQQQQSFDPTQTVAGIKGLIPTTPDHTDPPAENAQLTMIGLPPNMAEQLKALIAKTKTNEQTESTKPTASQSASSVTAYMDQLSEEALKNGTSSIDKNPTQVFPAPLSTQNLTTMGDPKNVDERFTALLEKAKRTQAANPDPTQTQYIPIPPHRKPENLTQISFTPIKPQNTNSSDPTNTYTMDQAPSKDSKNKPQQTEILTIPDLLKMAKEQRNIAHEQTHHDNINSKKEEIVFQTLPLEQYLNLTSQAPEDPFATYAILGPVTPVAPKTAEPFQFTLTLDELKQIIPGGMENLFTVHGPTKTKVNKPIEQVYEELRTSRIMGEGDAHANTGKVLSSLLIGNFVAPTDFTQAKKLFDILKEAEPLNAIEAKNHPKLNALCNEFKKALQGMKVTQELRNFFQLGDLVCDRGTYDKFTFILLDYIREQNPNLITMLGGNHDLNPLAPDNEKISFPQAKSFVGVAWLGNKADQAELKALYQQHIERTQLFAFIPEINGFSGHAVSTKSSIKRLIAFLNTRGLLPEALNDRDKITLQNLPQFVNITNDFYRGVMKSFATPNPDKEGFAIINSLTWGRSDLTGKDDKPFNIPGLRLLHGHDDATQKSKHDREYKAMHEGSLTGSGAGLSVFRLNDDYGKYDDTEDKTRRFFVIP